MGHRVRVTVVRADNAQHGAEVGDYCEIDHVMLTIPQGGKFPVYLLSAFLPVLLEKQTNEDSASWIERKPYLHGPDGNELVVVMLESIDDEVAQ